AVKTNQESIDKYIKENSSNGVESIFYVDYVVLQVAIAELIVCLENPYQVIIKESVEICYCMGTEEG
ncbi:transcription antitermination protein NusB, partial [Francisella tularensis subsp. holarctica]|uniref:transcription antitermination factor NusB n=1 Tax=Francisella tularensis TaxID=263 RepID=UPI002381A9AA